VTVHEQDVTAEKARAAKHLARKHFEVEPGLTRIMRYSGSPSIEFMPSEPIKLLEVNADTVPSGVMPLHFGPSVASGIIFPSVIIEVTPEEYDKIEKNELRLPEGWQTSEDLSKPNEI